MSNSTRWLSIDPGNDMGFAIWEGETLILSGCENLAQNSRNHEDTISALRRWLEQKLYKKANRIVQVVFEYPIVTRFNKGNSPIKQGEFIRVIKDECNKRGICWFDLSPSEVKKAVTGKGNAKKETVRKVVGIKYGERNQDNHNRADAVAIGMTWLLKFGPLEKEVVA